MGFRLKKIEEKAGGATGVKVCLRVSKSRAEALMTIYIRPSLVSEWGWVNNDPIEVYVGDGADHGFIRLIRPDAEPIPGSAKIEVRRTGNESSLCAIRLGHLKEFVSRAEPSKDCRFRLIEGFVEIRLPAWADETDPGKAPITPAADQAPAGKQPTAKPALPPAAVIPPRQVIPPAARQPVRQAPPQRGVSVTADVMGDPPPGRRQMLAEIGKIKS